MHSHLEQGRVWLERALALADTEDVVSPNLPKTLVATGYFARVQGDTARARSLGELALALAQQIGDKHGTAVAHHLLGMLATDEGEFGEALAHHQIALTSHQQSGYQHGVAFQISCLADVALAQGDFSAAASYGDEALTIWRERGDAWGSAWALIQLAKARRGQGDRAGALAWLHRCLDSNAALGDKAIAARAIAELADIAGEQGHFDLAARLFGAEAGLRDAIGASLAPESTGHEVARSTVRAALDEETFSQCWKAGRALSLAQAVSEGLAATIELS
jgi:non-specific serine/threonine protein kinase